ncbi:MAG: hypothetical protein J07HQW2_00450, partial [Haloquadratum walsbyi J07HQW2]
MNLLETERNAFAIKLLLQPSSDEGS